MNKVIKRIILGLCIMILFLIVYITIDCFRLKFSDFDTKPLITIGNSINDESEISKLDTNTKKIITYNAVGYSVTYKYDETKEDKVESYYKEFKLFNRFLIWSITVQKDS